MDEPAFARSSLGLWRWSWCLPYRGGPFVTRLTTVLIVGVMALLLQGCEADNPRHRIGNWRKRESFLHKYQVDIRGTGLTEPVLNSCMSDEVPAGMKCNGHGKCYSWRPNNEGLPFNLQQAQLFCKCDDKWADPECGTERKSQTTAFLLALFFGWFGVDRFYLGLPLTGMLKLLSLGGCGVWYLFDVVRIMASPVYSKDKFRVANDLPKYWSLLAIFALLFFFSFGFGFVSIMWHRIQRDREALLIKMQCIEAEDERQPVQASGQTLPQPARALPPRSGLRGYGTTQASQTRIPYSPFQGQVSSLRS